MQRLTSSAKKRIVEQQYTTLNSNPSNKLVTPTKADTSKWNSQSLSELSSFQTSEETDHKNVIELCDIRMHSTLPDGDWKPLTSKLTKKTYNALRDRSACPDSFC